MTPHDAPATAQLIVAEYLERLDRDAEGDAYPSSAGSLPFPKQTIREAFRVSTEALAASGQMDPEMSAYLEIAYVSLADYVDDEVVALMREFRAAGEALAAHEGAPRDRVGSDAWQRVSAQSRLAGEIARTISLEAEALRVEFRSWQGIGQPGRELT